MQLFSAEPDGILIKNEAVVHYNILVDLDLKSLEERTVVFVRCNVWSPNRQGRIGDNARVIWGDQLNNKPTTVEIPICVADVADPRSANFWRCRMKVLGSEEIVEQGGLHNLVFTQIMNWPNSVPAAGTTTVRELSGNMLFALDAPIVFEAGQ